MAKGTYKWYYQDEISIIFYAVISYKNTFFGRRKAKHIKIIDLVILPYIVQKMTEIIYFLLVAMDQLYRDRYVFSDNRPH